MAITVPYGDAAGLGNNTCLYDDNYDSDYRKVSGRPALLTMNGRKWFLPSSQQLQKSPSDVNYGVTNTMEIPLGSRVAQAV
jgi:hypothetical protein